MLRWLKDLAFPITKCEDEDSKNLEFKLKEAEKRLSKQGKLIWMIESALEIHGVILTQMGHYYCSLCCKQSDNFDTINHSDYCPFSILKDYHNEVSTGS